MKAEFKRVKSMGNGEKGALSRQRRVRGGEGGMFGSDKCVAETIGDLREVIKQGLRLRFAVCKGVEVEGRKLPIAALR